MTDLELGSLELSPIQMREMVDQAMNRITRLLTTFPDQKMDGSEDISPEDLAALVEQIPQNSTDFAALLDHIFEAGVPNSLNTAAPGFMGYIPGGGLFHAAIADLIGDSMNRYLGVAAVSPTLNAIEANVVRWFCEIVGYSPKALGFLTSGGSMASLSAVITARQSQLGDNFSKGTLYISDQIHHCLGKAARLAGFPSANIREIRGDENYRLCPDQIREAIMEDRARGLTPMFVGASAGTTNSGAVDPLPELADLCQEEGLWFHIDGAYGGFFCLTERGQKTLRGIDRADSIVLDPHKALFLPYGTGALLVRDGSTLRETHRSNAAYMPDLQDDNDLVDFCEFSPELTRPFRGLRVWLPMKLHGVGVFRDCLDEKLDLAQWIEREIAAIPELEVIAPTELSICTFAVADNGQTLEQRNRTTRKLIQFINAQQRVNLSGTHLHEIFVIRIAVLSFRTHKVQMEQLLEDIFAGLKAQGIRA